MLSRQYKSTALAIAITGCVVSTVASSENGGYIPPAPPLDSYGIVTDVYIPAIGQAKITWQKLKCGEVFNGSAGLSVNGNLYDYHVADGDPVTCSTINPLIIQAATTAALQQGAGQGWVDLKSFLGVCKAILPTKKYSERYYCLPPG